MLTLHVTGSSSVLVDGDTVAALGSPEELTAAHPSARVRRWPGLLTPGLLNPYGPEILESTYHPDPREAEEFGTLPIGGERARELFRTDPSRLGPSARRGGRGRPSRRRSSNSSAALTSRGGRTADVPAGTGGSDRGP